MAENVTIPWIEKYRASDFDEIKEQDTVIRMAKGIVERKLPMHLIFVGPAGTGKTSLAKIIIKHIHGDADSNDSMEVNASDKVRMDFIRNELNDFINQIGSNRRMKIILMEESDNIPSDAQQALRRKMEIAHKTTRFILTCNYLSNIIPALKSRCMIIRFQKVSEKGVQKVAFRIINNEGLELNGDPEKIISVLHSATNGDMRMMISTLQSCDMDRPIESVREMLGIIKPTVLRIMVKLVLKGKIKKIISKLNVVNRTSPRHFLLQFGDYLFDNYEFDGGKLKLITQLLAEYDKRLSEAGDQEIQLLGFISKLCIVLGDE